jgi:PTS system mannose-specific IID component
VLLRSFLVQGSWNYETLIGSGFAFTLLPALRFLYPGEADLRKAVARHNGLFNSHPYLVTVAAGAVSRLEAERTDPQTIDRFKNALRGSLGSLGDQLIWSAWRPTTVLLGIVLLLVGAAWWAAVAAFLVLYNALNIALRVWGWSVGTRNGLDVARALREAPLQSFAARVADAGALLGGFATVFAFVEIPTRPEAIGLALAAAVTGVVLGARTRKLFTVVIALVWFVALAWAWSR